MLFTVPQARPTPAFLPSEAFVHLVGLATRAARQTRSALRHRQITRGPDRQNHRPTPGATITLLYSIRRKDVTGSLIQPDAAAAAPKNAGRRNLLRGQEDAFSVVISSAPSSARRPPPARATPFTSDASSGITRHQRPETPSFFFANIQPIRAFGETQGGIEEQLDRGRNPACGGYRLFARNPALGHRRARK